MRERDGVHPLRDAGVVPPHRQPARMAERYGTWRGAKRLNMDLASRSAPVDDAPTLAPDLLRGANQIAAFLYGSAAERKKVYHLVGTARLPVFRLGSLLCARRSVLLAWIEAQETRGRQGR